MKSIDRAIFKVEEKLSQSAGDLTAQLQANLKYALAVFFWENVFVF